MKIKEPVLISKIITQTYTVDVEGESVDVRYSYYLDDEGKGYWDYDLAPLYGDMTDEEIDKFEDEFAIAIEDIPL